MSRIIKLENIADFNASAINKNDSFSEINYLDTGSITRNVIDSYQNLKVGIDGIPSRAKRKVKDKTIIYSTVRPNQEHFGFMVNPLDNLIVSTGFCTIDINDDGIDPKYIYYLITQPHITEYLHTIGMNSVSAYPSINPSDIANLHFQIPEIEEQKKLASVLSTLDEKIDLNNQINTTLEQMAKTLYDYWFVQFDFPDENGKPYKSSGGEMVYNETLKREIPKGWKVKEIQDYCRIFTGKKDVNQASEIGKYKFFSCAPNYKYSDEKLFEGKAILVSGNGSYTGRTIFVNDAFDLYQRTYAVVSNTDIDILEYIFYSMLRSFVPKVAGGTHGSAIPYIVYNDIAKEHILFNENLVFKFMKVISNIQRQIIDLSEQNIKLTEIRDWLLPMLMNGQVTVA